MKNMIPFDTFAFFYGIMRGSLYTRKEIRSMCLCVSLRMCACVYVLVCVCVSVCLCASIFEPDPATRGRPRLRMVQRGRGDLSRLVRWQGVQEDDDTVPGEKQCRGVVSRGDGGSSVQEFRFGPDDYVPAATWVLRDVLDNACGDARCCNHARSNT
jgi:hypothetical protein